VVTDRMEDPQEDLLAVHCFCVCSGSALLGDLLGVSKSVARDFVCLSCLILGCNAGSSGILLIGPIFLERTSSAAS